MEENDPPVESNQESYSQRRGARVIATDPDRTLGKYIVDEFKNQARGSKDVDFERINLGLYKPKAKLVGFRTSESRILLWIEAFVCRYIDFVGSNDNYTVSWEEQESYTDPGKPDKIQLLVKEKEEKLFVVSIFVSTGRIQVQGAHYRQWTHKEFPHLLKLVNLLAESKESAAAMKLIDCTKHYLFNDEVEENENVEDKDADEGGIESDSGESSESSDSEDDETTTAVSADKETIQHLINTLARMESEFTAFKATVENELLAARISLREIPNMTDKLVRIENNCKAYSVSFDDRLFHNESATTNANTKIDELTAQVKQLNDHKKQLINKQTQMKADIDELKNENKALKQELFIMKEIATKHENCLESIIDLQNPSGSEQDADVSGGQCESRPDAEREIKDKETSTKSKVNNLPNSVSKSKAKDDGLGPVLFLSDSNGKFIKQDLLCPGVDTKFVRTFTLTLAEAEDAALETDFPAQTVLVHVGTNDLEALFPEDVINQSKSLLDTIKAQLPEARIIYSSLLPRQDKLNHQVKSVNEQMERFCKSRPNVVFLGHSHIQNTNQFYDRKHLNIRGVKFFAKNLKSAIYGTQTKAFRRTNPFFYDSPRRGQPLNEQGRWNQGPPQTRSNKDHGLPTLSSPKGTQPQLYRGSSVALTQSQGVHPAQQRPSYASVVQPGLSNQYAAQSMNGMDPTMPLQLKSLIQQLQRFI